MRTILVFAAALAAAPTTFAASSVRHSTEGKNAEDRLPEPSSEPLPGSGAAQGAYPSELAKNMVWVAYPRLKDVPEKHGAHGILRVPSRSVGWAVGFITNEGFPETQLRSGWCWVGPSPSTPTPDACKTYVWISAAPGGPPVGNCVRGPRGGAAPNTLAWYVHGRKNPARPGTCVLEHGRRYFCHYATAGWDRTDEHKPSHCDNTMASPLSGVPD